MTDDIPIHKIFQKNTLSVISQFLSINEKKDTSLITKKIQENMKQVLKVKVQVEEKKDVTIDNLDFKLEEINKSKTIESYALNFDSRKYDLIVKTPSIINLSIFIHRGQENLDFLGNLQNLKRLEITG